MKKAIILSAVLILTSGSSFAAGTTPTSFNSKHACEFKTHGACVQEGANWVAAPATTTTAPAATTTTTTAPSTTTTTATTTTAPTPPTPPTPPAATTNAAPSSNKGWWPFSGGNKSATPSKTPPVVGKPAGVAPKPADPLQTARGKVYGSQGDCQGETRGNCVATDCKTHVGGVCEGNSGTVWTYAH
jgi:hypothetical protein